MNSSLKQLFFNKYDVKFRVLMTTNLIRRKSYSSKSKEFVKKVSDLSQSYVAER